MSMGSADINFTTNAEDVASQNETLAGSLNDVGAAADSAASTGSTNYGQFGATLGRVSVMGVVAMDRLAIAQMAVENAQIRAENAQQRYTDAVRKYGPASEQAIRAHKELEIATRGVEIATQREEVRTLIMAGVVIPQMIRGIYNMIPALQEWAVNNGIVELSTINLTRAQMALLAVSVVGIPLLIAGAAMTGGFGLMGGGASTFNNYGDINMTGSMGPNALATNTAAYAQATR
jgi:hypothetical protein